MNIQKIFTALEEDADNSALGVVVAELESQGYGIAVEGRRVNAVDIFDGRHADLENRIGPLNIALYKGEAIEQEFAVEFTDYHYAVFRRSVK